MSGPSLTRHDVDDPHGLVLMLHGGRADGLEVVDETSASWRRSHWMMSQITGRLNRTGVGVWLLRYSVRGWNAGVASPPSPVPDARWALDEVRRELGDVPVVLLGHSMGGRTAVAVADDENVAGVVALAPWLSPGDPERGLRGKHLSAAHGRSDKITSFGQTRAFCQRAERIAASVEFRDMGRVGHYMLRHIPAWNRFAVEQSLTQLGVTPTTHGRTGAAPSAQG
jgi:predicted alpha/beta-hydrolase family hydrolase